MMLRKLTSALLIAGISAGVQAAPQDPIFTEALDIEERYAYSLIEAMLSLVAMNVEHTSECNGSYDANVLVSKNGSVASATVDDVELVANDAGDVYSATKGTKIQVVQVNSPPRAQLGDVEVDGLLINSTYDFYGTMAGMEGDVVLDGDSYNERVIKDFWEDNDVTLPDDPDPPQVSNQNVLLDFGYELITKLDYPRAKYDQFSYLWRSNGGNGYLLIEKNLIAPDPIHNPCAIVFTALVGDFGGGFQTISGNIELED